MWYVLVIYQLLLMKTAETTKGLGCLKKTLQKINSKKFLTNK